MISDDIFATQLNVLTEAARVRLAAYGSAISAAIEETQTYTRMAAKPASSGTCPIELIVHATQRVDLSIATEIYEDLSARDITTLLSLFNAAALGLVITRKWRHGMSGIHIGTETVFTAAPAAQATVTANRWSLRHNQAGRAFDSQSGAIANDVRYTPWTR